MKHPDLPKHIVSMMPAWLSEMETAGLKQHEKYETLAKMFVDVAMAGINRDPHLKPHASSALPVAAEIMMAYIKMHARKALATKA